MEWGESFLYVCKSRVDKALHKSRAKYANIGGYMKKFLFALALFISASHSFANCATDYFNMLKSGYLAYTGVITNYFPDSMYVDKGNAENRGKSIYIMKYYYSNSGIDSIYEANYREATGWTTQVTPMKKYDITKEGDLTVLRNVEDYNSTISFYVEDDSMAVFEEENGEKYSSIYFLKNDTLFRIEYGNEPDEMTYPDPADTNTCYQSSKGSNGWNVWYRHESKMQNDTLVITRTYMEDGMDFKTYVYFFAPKIKDNPLFIRKIKPTATAKQFRYFDLMGRPAKQNQHIIKVVK